VSSACAQKSPPLNIRSQPFKTEDFEITLADNWIPDHDDSSFGWQDGKSMQEIRIVVMHIPVSVRVEDAVRDYLSIRRETLKEFAGDSSITSDSGISKTANGEVSQRFRVESNGNNVRMCTVVRANSRRLVSFTFLKYAPLLSFEDIDKRCDELVAKLVIH
jgi:hypothetical protein